jgi:hypothetical protein
MFSQTLTARADSIAHHLETVFLFTQNDVRTTLIPVVCDNYCESRSLVHLQFADHIRVIRGSQIQPRPRLACSFVDMVPFIAVQHCKPDPGSGGGPQEQALPSDTCWSHFCRQRS